MNKLFKSIGIICLSSTLVATAAAQSGPRIALSQEVWDFGEVWEEDRPMFTLEVMNVGDEVLRLGQVRTT